MINVCYNYLGFGLGVRRQESGVRMNKFGTFFYVLTCVFHQIAFPIKPFNSGYYL
ncbi:MAG: hypothetical protein AB4080_17230 [Trichodesmium sp.]